MNEKKKITYVIEFANVDYEIRCFPLSYHYTVYLASSGKPTMTVEESNKRFEEVAKESEAEYLVEKGTGTTQEIWSTDLGILPNPALKIWLDELMFNSQTKATIKVKQIKN